MKFIDLLKTYMDDKKRVIINGLGAGETRGLIIEVHEDYITYELLEVKKLKGSDKEKQTKEIKYIPIFSISDISEGEKETETTNGLSAFTK